MTNDPFLSLPLHAHLAADSAEAFPMLELNRVVEHWAIQGVFISDVTVQPQVLKGWQDEIRSSLIRAKLSATDPDVVTKIDTALKEYDVIQSRTGPRMFATSAGAVEIHLTTD